MDEDCAKAGKMPVAAKTLMVPPVNSAARALNKIPEYHDLRKGLPTKNLQESSVLWRSFTSDRAGDNIYNVDMVRIFRRGLQNHNVLTFEP